MTLEHNLLQLARDAMLALINGRHFGTGQTGHYLNIISRIEAELAKPEQVSGDTSDGYHTFNELYDFRKAYNAALFNEWAQNNKYSVHKSKRHFDGENCFGGGWFIVVAQLPDGQISNHYEMKDWDKFLLPETDKALFEYDNHTGADVLQRLFSLRPPEVANEFYPDWDTLQPFHERIAELEAQLAQQLEQEPVLFPSFMRKRIEQAMEDAINPRGMSVHDGKARVLASDLHRMILIIDSAIQRKPWVGLTQEEVQEIAKQLIDDAAYCSTHFAIAIEAELRRKNNAV